MHRLYLLDGTTLYSGKAKSLKQLADKDVRIPFSIVFNEEYSEFELVELLKNISSEYVYLRISFPDNTYPNYFSITTPVASILKEIDILIKKVKLNGAKFFDIIIQPILNFKYSGVFLVKNNRILVEGVIGHPISLLRLGEVKYRILMDTDLNVIDTVERVQISNLRWEKNNLIKEDFSTEDFSINQIIASLKNVRIEEDLLYEFGLYNNEIIYLEYKPINEASYLDLQNNSLLTPFVILNDNSYPDFIKFDMPTIENINLINKGKNHIVKEGAYLSHFATYCAFNNINCAFLS